MKTKLILLIACLGIFFYSCEDVQNGTTTFPAVKQVMVTTIDTIHEVNTDVVRHVAECYTQSVQTRSGAGKKIKEIIPVKNEAGVAAMYIVNFENNQGYIIISGSNEYQPVLAFSEEGYFDINSTNGSSVWLSEQQGFIKNIKSLPDSIRHNNKRAWNQFFKKEKTVQLTSNSAQTRSVDSDLEHRVGMYIEETLNKWGDEGYQIYPYSSIQSEEIFSRDEIEQIEQILEINADRRFFDGAVYVRLKIDTENTAVSPLLKSTWNQDGGYAAYTPNNYYLGCGAVAVGQILRYHESPILYNWKAMAYTYPTDLTARFLLEVAEKMYTTFLPGGSPSTTGNTCKALREYGYPQSSIVNHKSSSVVGELINKRPLFMRGSNKDGEGHAWVCDGYTRSQTYNYYEVMALDRMVLERQNIIQFVNWHSTTIGNTSTYFHMNWGWGGSKDGYFYEDNVNPPGDNFSGGRQDIIGISPSK